jgi:hypothetical protein
MPFGWTCVLPVYGDRAIGRPNATEPYITFFNRITRFHRFKANRTKENVSYT